MYRSLVQGSDHPRTTSVAVLTAPVKRKKKGLRGHVRRGPHRASSSLLQGLDSSVLDPPGPNGLVDFDDISPKLLKGQVLIDRQQEVLADASDRADLVQNKVLKELTDSNDVIMEDIGQDARALTTTTST